jgi:hypothetical protein
MYLNRKRQKTCAISICLVRVCDRFCRYKSHLETTRTGGAAATDSAKANLAATFVNAFVNAGFGHDRLMTERCV